MTYSGFEEMMYVLMIVIMIFGMMMLTAPPFGMGGVKDVR